MDASRFVSPAFGRPVSTGGSYPYVAFVPAEIPARLDLDLATIRALSEADSSLGRLAGAGRLLPNPHLLTAPYMTQEALASSRIEGTQASLSEVFDAAASGNPGTTDVQEVQNYILALEHGLQRLSTLPLSKRLLCEMHKILMQGVRGREKTPGEFRRSQNWIGSPDNRPETAVFVPPTPEDMWPALDQWEHYVHHRSPQLPLLVRCALLHYQFETIHPFLDGNGRLGRAFLVVYLVEQGALTLPLLPLSAFLEQHRSDYYDRLQAVRERGEIAQWLRFFLTAVTEQARASWVRAEKMTDLREQYREALHGTRTRAPEVVDLIFSNPVLYARFVARRLNITQQGAINLLRQLTRIGALREEGGGRGVLTRWHADAVLELLF